MDDIDYLLAHGERRSFQFMIDSRNRDKSRWPTPSEYVIPFSTAFTHVIAVDVLEASVPRTNYNVDDATCSLAFATNGGPWTTVTVPTGDYDVLTLCDALTTAMAPVKVAPTSVPAEVKSTLTFTSSAPFKLSFSVPNSMAEVLGFDAPAADGQAGYLYGGSATTFASAAGNVLVAPGIYSMVGDRYVLLRCTEVENSRDASTEAYSPGIAKFTLGVVGYANASLDYVNGGVREFHPIGRMSRLTLRFERPDGTLYNFRGVNHTLTLVVRYLAPKREIAFQRSTLNPNYDGNFLQWPRTDEEREGDSDDETDAYNAVAAPLAEAGRASARAAPTGQAAARAEMVRKMFA